MTDMAKTLERAHRLIRAATGEEYGDGYIITDVGTGISEPGYGGDTVVWATGDYNPKRWVRDGDAPLTPAESLPERLGRALERQGVECLWLDEWIRCNDCFKLFRTTGDSYSWQMYGYFVNDCEPVCADCLTWDDVEADVVNSPTHAVLDTWGIDLTDHGYVQAGDYYENGWFPGQDDDPQTIMERLHADGHPEVVFSLDRVQQFDARFTAYVLDDPMRLIEALSARIEETVTMTADDRERRNGLIVEAVAQGATVADVARAAGVSRQYAHRLTMSDTENRALTDLGHRFDPLADAYCGVTKGDHQLTIGTGANDHWWCDHCGYSRPPTGAERLDLMT
jgi:hypothetical protein